ncbi:ROK family protein [Moritella sp. 28]|uniref:ROK family protein n=1 Tax=Moritella sp. 28 TaxID=2746232 RepID=UPI001BA4E7A9|nr:ROK family protein [Moritella sp. 28]QUM86376.1 ROK family protein [Moritella sp. 28]
MYYGFDIGGTKIEFSVYNTALECVFNERIPAPTEDYEELLDALDTFIFKADKKFDCKGLVGIGYPGVMDPDTNTLICSNLPSLHGQDLQSDLKKRISRDVKVQNDANCFALSECYKGAAEDAGIAIAVTLGTGLGGAICINKTILSGHNFGAGEFGHMAIPGTMLQRYPELPVTHCGCGGHSCLETYCSGTGLAALYKHYKIHMNGSCNEEQALKGPDIIAAYEANEMVAVKTVTVFLDILAAALGSLIMALDPNVVVFGGGLARFEALYSKLPEKMAAYVFSNMKLPALKQAEFGGEGGVRGAALLNYK